LVHAPEPSGAGIRPPLGKFAQTAAGFLPKPVAARAIEKFAVDRMEVLHEAIDTVRRGGTLSISGVYGGQVDRCQ
jgi:threonine dehydrogenase-like Zn-dependent dehydrogenase